MPGRPHRSNEAFEAEYETYEYEAKIKKLLSNAHDRLKKEGSPALANWEESLKALDQTDDYIPILGGRSPLARLKSPEGLRSLLRFFFRLAVIISAAYVALMMLRFLFKMAGVSPASMAGALFLITLLALAIRPRLATNLTARPMSWIVTFLFKRSGSNEDRTR